jgi:hypothetical protein
MHSIFESFIARDILAAYTLSTHRGAHALVFVRHLRHAHAGAADEYAHIGFARLDELRRLRRGACRTARGCSTSVRADLEYTLCFCVFEVFLDGFLEGEAGFVGTDDKFHFKTSPNNLFSPDQPLTAPEVRPAII